MAQFGRALRSGRRGCGFKSRHLDQKEEVGFCLSLLFHLNEELNLLLLLFPNEFGTKGKEHNRRLWRMQGVRVGAAVKIVRSEKRANNFGYRKRALVGSNPVISTKKQLKTKCFRLLFFYLNHILLQ